MYKHIFLCIFLFYATNRASPYYFPAKNNKTAFFEDAKIITKLKTKITHNTLENKSAPPIQKPSITDTSAVPLASK